MFLLFALLFFLIVFALTFLQMYIADLANEASATRTENKKRQKLKFTYFSCDLHPDQEQMVLYSQKGTRPVCLRCNKPLKQGRTKTRKIITLN
jgi:hypothetical protein